MGEQGENKTGGEEIDGGWRKGQEARGRREEARVGAREEEEDKRTRGGEVREKEQEARER